MWLHLKSTDPGAPALSSTVGAMCAIFDWALPQAGWTIEFTGTNKRIYRMPAGSRHYLSVTHDDIALTRQYAQVRAAAGATDIDTLIDPYPNDANLANKNWYASNTTGATIQPWDIFISDTYMYWAPYIGGRELNFFGDMAPSYSGDIHCTAIHTRNLPTTSLSYGIMSQTSPTITGSSLFFSRDASGSILSTRGNVLSPSSQFNTVTGASTARGGYQQGIYRERVYGNCFGSSGTTAGANALYKRAQFPNLYQPMHTGNHGLTEDDTFTDSSYNPLAVFMPLILSASGFCIMEITDTWSPL